MSDEEMLGILRMIQEQQAKILKELNWIKAQQAEVKAKSEAEPVVGSFASSNQ
jgi:hypothetical protein